MGNTTSSTTKPGPTPPRQQLKLLTYNIRFDGGFQKPTSTEQPSKEAPPNEGEEHIPNAKMIILHFSFVSYTIYFSLFVFFSSSYIHLYTLRVLSRFAHLRRSSFCDTIITTSWFVATSRKK